MILDYVTHRMQLGARLHLQLDTLRAYLSGSSAVLVVCGYGLHGMIERESARLVKYGS